MKTEDGRRRTEDGRRKAEGGGMQAAYMEVDQALANLAEDRSRLEVAEKMFSAEMEGLAGAWEPIIKQLKEVCAADEKQLKKLAKQHKGYLFPTEKDDKAAFSAGIVWRKAVKRVRRIKGMLEKIRAAGGDLYRRAVKVSESVVWDEVEKMDDKTLEALGTKREVKENFEFETKKPEVKQCG